MPNVFGVFCDSMFLVSKAPFFLGIGVGKSFFPAIIRDSIFLKTFECNVLERRFVQEDLVSHECVCLMNVCVS